MPSAPGTTSVSPSAWTTGHGAFLLDPVDYWREWYGEVGHFLTTKFFAMKINRYMHDYGISAETLARVAAKGYRNGVLNPNALRRKAISEEEILSSRMLNYPLTQYMFCSPDEGAAAVVMCRADLAKRYTSNPIRLRATAVRTASTGVRDPRVVGCGRIRRCPHHLRVKAAYDKQGSGRPTSTSQLQADAARGHPHGRTASAPMASRRN